MKKEQTIEGYLIFDQTTGTYTMDPEQAVRDEVEKNHWLDTAKTILKDWRLYIMLVPMLFVFICWRYLPMYELIRCFKFNETGINTLNQDFVGFYYFKVLLSGDQAAIFWPAFRNTFLLSFYGLVFGFPFPIIVALLLNEVRSNAARSVYQVLIYLPKFLSTVVIATLVTLLVQGSNKYTQPGIISQFLENIGAISNDTAKAGLLYSPDYFRAIYQISGIWEDAGYGSIVFFAAIIAISPTSYEAAQIDGAGKMQQMQYVVLPSILSTIVIMLIMRIGSLLSIGFEKVLLLSTDKNYITANVVSTYANAIGVGGNSKGVASAAEMVTNLIGMFLVIGSNMIARKASDVSLY